MAATESHSDESMNYADFIPVIGIIVNIARSDCCSQMLTLRTEDGIVKFLLTSDTRVIDSRRLRQGMRVAVFYDESLPVPLIFPPQYQAQLVAVLGRNEQIMLNYFDRNLLAGDSSLQLNIARNTPVQTVNGQMFSCDIGERTLLVYYSSETRSIPSQTTPDKIVVLC